MREADPAPRPLGPIGEPRLTALGETDNPETARTTEGASAIDAWVRAATRLIVALAALSAACGEDVCGAATLPRCDIREVTCQARVQEAVRCMRGAGPSTLPPITLLTLPELEVRLRAGADPEMMRTLEWESALKLLRLLDPGEDLLEASIAGSLASVLAFYSTAEQAVYVIDRGMAADSVDAVATLAHELVHAAQDEEHDLHARLDAVETHEELMLLRGVVEGEATFYTYEAYLWDLGYGPGAIDWGALHDEALARARARLDATSSPYHAVYGDLPYVIGGRWASDRFERGGDELVRAGVPEPPPSSAWLMVNPYAPGGTPPPHAGARCDAPPPPDGFSARPVDEMGAPLVYAFLRRWGMTHAEAWALALEWRGDELHVYGAPDGRVALAWRIVFDRIATPRWTATQIESQTDLFRAGYAEDTVVLLTSDDAAVTDAWTWSATSPVCAAPP